MLRKKAKIFSYEPLRSLRRKNCRNKETVWEEEVHKNKETVLMSLENLSQMV